MIKRLCSVYLAVLVKKVLQMYQVSNWYKTCTDPESYFRGGPTLKQPIIALYFEPETVLKFYIIEANINKEPYIFVIFQWGGGGSGPPVSPLDPHMKLVQNDFSNLRRDEWGP